MIDPRKLVDDLIARLQEDGVTIAYAQVAAVRFARELEKEHPDWFKPAVVDLASFVVARLAESKWAPTAQKAAGHLLKRYDFDLEDNKNNPYNEFNRGALYASYHTLYWFAKEMWGDHEDFKRVNPRTPYAPES